MVVVFLQKCRKLIEDPKNKVFHVTKSSSLIFDKTEGVNEDPKTDKENPNLLSC